ncbi:hypothetical protein ACWCPQ_17410 [Nocardia sp. NPDC001965]
MYYEVSVRKAHDRVSGNTDRLFDALELCSRFLAVGGENLGFDEGADTREDMGLLHDQVTVVRQPDRLLLRS